MPQTTIKNINYLIKGETGNIVNLDIQNSNVSNEITTKTFITDTGLEVSDISSSSMTHRIIKTSTSNNKNIFYDMVGSDSIIYALFDFKDVAIKSTSNIDIYAPHLSTDPIGFCTVVNSNSKIISFGISESTSSSPIIKGTNLRDTRQDRINGLTNSMYWNYKMIESGNKTYLGIPLSNLYFSNSLENKDGVDISQPSSYFQYLESFGKLSVDMISTFFDPKYNLENVDRNYIYQINLGGSNTTIYNDFNTGNLFGDFIIGKNPYDSKYSMNMSSVNELKNTRRYDGVGSVGGRVFFKYHDDIDYTGVSKEKLSTNISSEIQNLEMLSSINNKENNFQKVEFLDSTSQFKSVSKHKSNLFSIKIRKLFDNISSSVILDNISKIKDDISRNISKIAESFAPAHTQLFEIFYDNKSNMLGNSNENIGFIDDAIFLFLDDSNKTEITGLTRRGKYEKCLKIPANVSAIVDGALNQSLENIKFLVENDNKYFSVKNNVLYRDDEIISYPVNTLSTKYIISEETSDIYTSAFYNCNNLKILYKPLSIETNLELLETTTLFTYYSYLINYKSDNETNLSVMPQQKIYTYDLGKLQKNKFEKTGYKFNSWEYKQKSSDSLKQILDESYIEEPLSPNYGTVDLSAVWDPISYSIKFSKDKDSSIFGTMNDLSAIYGFEIQLSKNAFSKKGYNFRNWFREDSFQTYDDEATISNLTSVDFDKIILFPNFVANTYYVDFYNTKEEIQIDFEKISCLYDKAFSLKNIIEENKVVSDDNFILSAWVGTNVFQKTPLFENELSSWQFDSLKNLTDKNEDTVTLSTVFAPKYYVEYDSGVNDNSVSGNTLSQYFVFGDKERKLSKNGFSREFYFFDGWKYDNETYSDEEPVKDLTETETPGQILTFTASWTEKFTVIFDGNGATSGSMENQYFRFNNSQNLYENQFTKTGYEFKGWSFEEYSFDDSDIISSEIDYYYDGNNQISFTVDDSNKDKFNENRQLTLYAVWEPNVYKVRFNKNF